MKRKRRNDSFFVAEGPSIPTFGTGEAAEILGIPIWRLQKFVDSRQYNLSPEGKLGSGRGSRRVFTREDLHRIALANWLVKDGFAPQFIGSVVQQLEDDQVGVYIDHEGEEADLALVFYRGKDGPGVMTLKVGSSWKYSQEPYYRVDLHEVFKEVDARIAKLKK